MASLEQVAADRKVGVLQFQNKKLSEQLEAHRAKIKTLEGVVEKDKAEQQRYASTLLYVNRAWEQLNRQIESLCEDALAKGGNKGGANTADEEMRDANEVAGGTDGGLGGLATADSASGDPPMARLLASDLAVYERARDKCGGQAEDGELVDAFLTHKAAASVAALRRVADAVAARRLASLDQLQEQVRLQGAGEQVAYSVEALRKEHRAALRQLESKRLLAEQLEQALAQAKDAAFLAQDKVKQLGNELADKDFALENALRKLQRAKTAPPPPQQQQQPPPPQQQQQPQQEKPQQQQQQPQQEKPQQQQESAEPQGTAPPQAPDQAGVAEATRDEAREDVEAELLSEIKELQQLLIKRSSEVEREAEAHRKTQRELDAARGRPPDEAWVPATATYQRLQREVARLTGALEHKQREADALFREREEAAKEAAVRALQVEGERSNSNRLAEARAVLRNMQLQKKEAEQARQELELALHREREARGHAPTAQEQAALIASLHKEGALLRERLDKGKTLTESLGQTTSKLQDALVQIVEKEQTLSNLAAEKKSFCEELEAAKAREGALKERVGDLKAFVDVLTTFCNDPTLPVESLTREARLKDEVVQLQARLEGGALQQELKGMRALHELEKGKAAALSQEADELRVKVHAAALRVEELQTQAAALKEEGEAYIEEIKALSTAYEDMQGQNTRLLSQINSKDQSYNALVAERIKLTQQHESLNDQLESAKAGADSLRAELADLRKVKEHLDKEFIRLTNENVTLRDQVRGHGGHLEHLSRELAEAQEGAASLAAQLDGAHGGAVAARGALEEERERGHKDRAKRARLEEDIQSLQGKVERMRRSQSASAHIQELESEVSAMRSLLNCNVCHARQKNVILTKCWHMFCEKCIRANLETRHRKCPGCGHPFGAQDVKQFFFT